MAGRRQFLKTLVGGGAALASPSWMAGAAGFGSLMPQLALAREHTGGGAAAPAVVSLTDNLALVTGAGGNVVALSGSEGLLLVDTGAPDRTRELLKVVATLPGARAAQASKARTPSIPVAFNTHWHWDHTGGNEALHRLGTKVIAHENTRLWLGEPIWSEWQNRHYAPRPKEAWPSETFWTTGQMQFGGEPIEYGHLTQAHTDGDLYVYFRKQNVLATGCVLAVGHYPILDYCTGGWIGGMADATKKLLDITDEKTRIVPGIGPVQTRADLAAEHEMLATLWNDLWQDMRKGYGAEDMIAHGVTKKYDDRWGNPDLFLRQAFQGLYGHVREMRGAV
ncbi:MAG TPA: MBL fold metallo-hydrolase [Steroidobacteraceae bacterium]|nr:MBL fold metallo-hydrolase [Steroidobacteraceae bacterium]